jgi:hypothetical protein
MSTAGQRPESRRAPIRSASFAVLLLIAAVACLVTIAINSRKDRPRAGTLTESLAASPRHIDAEPPKKASLSRLAQRGWEMGADGPALTDAFTTYVLQLDPPARDEVNRVLQAIHRESLALEQSRSERMTGLDRRGSADRDLAQGKMVSLAHRDARLHLRNICTTASRGVPALLGASGIAASESVIGNRSAARGC